MTGDEIEKRVKLAVDCIVMDLTDRSGFDNQWAATDKDIQQEIIERWRELVTKAFTLPPSPDKATVQISVPVCDEYPNCIHCSARIANAQKK